MTRRWLGPAAALVLLLAFLALKQLALRPHLNDDGIYLYGAARLAQGTLPYRDFFHAHPPLHLAPLALLFAVFGPSFVLAKELIFVLAAAQGLCAFVLVRKLTAGRPAAVREVSAVLACALLLFGETFLIASSDDTGLVQSSACLAFAATALAFRRFRVAGICAGVAVMTSLQVAPLAAAVTVAAGVFRGRGAAVRVGLATAAVVALVHLGGLALFGRPMFEQMYLFHLAKQDVRGEGLRALRELVLHNLPLFVTAAAGAAALLLRRRAARSLGALLAGAVVVYLLAMGTRPRAFYWYFVPALFPLALLAGAGFAAAARRRSEVGWVLAALPILSLLVQTGPAEGIRDPHLREALAGRRTPIAAYVRRERRWLETFPQIVAAVRQAAPPGAALYGDYAIAPLVAVAAGVRVLDDDVDTTGQRFRAGFLRLADVAARLSSSPATLLLLREGGSGANELLSTLNEDYLEIARFDSRSGVSHGLYVRRGGAIALAADPLLDEKPKDDERPGKNDRQISLARLLPPLPGDHDQLHRSSDPLAAQGHPRRAAQMDQRAVR
jgi:hypothetical protein